MSKLSKNRVEQDRAVFYVDEDRNQKILQALSKNFTLTGYPIKVTSKNNKKHTWLKQQVLKNNIDICKFIVDFVAFEMPEMHEIFNPIRAGVVGAIIMTALQQLGEFSDKCEFTLDEDAKKHMNVDDKIIEDGVAERKTLTVDEAIKEITEIYDVDLAFDGNDLRLFNKKNNDTHSFGGVIPFLAVAAIIQKKLGYLHPECELILDVTKGLYKIAKAKDEKPYITPIEKRKEAEKDIVQIDFSRPIRDCLL